MKARVELNKRGTDSWGSGEYGASRGKRKHKGVDYVCEVGAEVYPVNTGVVTKLGYPYGDDLSYRYVQVTANGMHYRYFYVEPTVLLGAHVHPNMVIGTAQNLDKRYAGITPHIHLEVKDDSGEYYNPEEFV